MALAGLLGACSPGAPAVSVANDVSPEVYRGSSLARQVCSRCHDIGAGSAPEERVGAPDFKSVAARPGMTVQEIVAWMKAKHPVMPTYMLDDRYLGDVAAYIMSLRTSGS